MENKVVFQAFEWHSSDAGDFYRNLAARAGDLKALGVGAVWLPPAAKGVSVFDVGYSSYDLWDLGEFEQHDTVRTKYGTKAELQACIQALQAAGIKVFADVVFNHKGGADYTERFQAVEVNPENRLEEISEPHDIEGWTGFNFPGRGGKYSEFVWNFSHFSGVDYDQSTQQSGIFKILGENKDWSKETSSEKGNYDYLMNADIDHSHPDVVAELERYAFWLIEEMGYDGFRYDALKHISSTFIANLTAKIHEKYPDFEFFGEYWEGADEQLSVYLEQSDYRIQLFDVPLHFRFQAASNDPGYDLSQLFSGALVHEYPAQAVTFVDNHDSQPGQSLESWVAPEFKEIAYALILLRRDGYPCIFAGDFDGIQEADYPGIETELRRLMALRRDYAYGEEELLFTEADAFGLLRHGTEEHPGKLLLLYSRSEEREVEVDFSANWAGRCFVEAHLAGLPGGIPELMEEGVELNSEAGQAALAEAGALVRLDESGRGSFKVLPGTLAYWYSL